MPLPRLPLIRLSGWPRRLLALACLLLAVSSFVNERAGSAAARHDGVLVATHDLAAGAVLTAGDTSRQQWPAGRAPHTVLHDAAQVVGRRVAGPVAAGEAITANRLVGGELTRGLTGSQVAVAVPVAAEVPSFVRPGDRVDLLGDGAPPAELSPSATDVKPGTVLATHVAVLAVLPAATAGGPDAAASLIVATQRDAASRLVGGGRTRLSVLLSG